MAFRRLRHRVPQVSTRGNSLSPAPKTSADIQIESGCESAQHRAHLPHLADIRSMRWIRQTEEISMADRE